MMENSRAPERERKKPKIWCTRYGLSILSFVTHKQDVNLEELLINLDATHNKPTTTTTAKTTTTTATKTTTPTTTTTTSTTIIM